MGVSYVLIAGDFNLALFIDLDRLYSPSVWTSGLSQWASVFALSDMWRHFHLSDRAFTCHSATYRMFLRIDLAFATSEALGRVVSLQGNLRPCSASY